MDFGRMLGYTEALSKNNDRTWFHDNHRQYEQAQEDFLMVLDVMKFVLAKDAPQIGDELLFENPKNFMYRIPRDMRYSKTKRRIIRRSGRIYRRTKRTFCRFRTIST